MNATRRAFVLVFILVFLTAACIIEAKSASGEAIVGNSWSTVASIPMPQQYNDILVASAVNGQIFVFGFNLAECYNPETNNWTAIFIPQNVNGSYYSSSVEYQNKIYLMGANVQVYDSSSGNWTSKASMPGSFLGQNAVVVGNKIYVIGGSEGVYTEFIGISNATYVYDPAADSWSTMAPIPVPVAYYASAVINNKIYIIGGGTGNTGLNNATNLVQIFDPSTNQWTESTPIPTGVFAAGSCTTTGLLAPERIYVVAGSLTYDWGGSATYSTAETETSLNQVYNPAAGNWSSAAPLPYNNSYFSLLNVDDALYAVGGFDSNDFNIVTVEKYIPAGYTAASTSPTPTVPEFSTLGLPLLLVTVSAIATTKLTTQVKKTTSKKHVGNG